MAVQTAFNFNYTTVNQIVENAFLLIGIEPALIDDQKRWTSIFHINLILTQWVNTKVLQFNEVLLPIPLENNIPGYKLPVEIYDVYDAQVGSYSRINDGLPFSTGGGVPANAFDGNLNTIYVSTLPNAYLGIALNEPKLATFFGVSSGALAEYQLMLEGSYDGLSWIPLYTMERPQLFSDADSLQDARFFSLNTPGEYAFYRLSNLGDAPLVIREFYLHKYEISRSMGKISRNEYQQIASKYVTSIPSQYTMFKTNENIFVNIYPLTNSANINTPAQNSGNYNFMLLRAARFPYDVQYLSYPLDLQRRFLPALFYKLAATLAMIYKPDKYEMLQNMSAATFMAAGKTDNDKGGLKIQLPVPSKI